MRGPRSATGQVFYGLLDTDDVPLDVLQVQPPSDNLAASDLKKSVTPRISKACPSLRVPDQRHSVQVMSPSWTDRQIWAQKSGIPASMASQLASIWARPVKALPGCAGCSLR